MLLDALDKLSILPLWSNCWPLLWMTNGSYHVLLWPQSIWPIRVLMGKHDDQLKPGCGHKTKAFYGLVSLEYFMVCLVSLVYSMADLGNTSMPWLIWGYSQFCIFHGWSAGGMVSLVYFMTGLRIWSALYISWLVWGTYVCPALYISWLVWGYGLSGPVLLHVGPDIVVVTGGP